MAIMATDVMDINTDPDCTTAKDPDMVPSCSPGPDVTKALVRSTCHLDLYGPGCNMPLGDSMVGDQTLAAVGHRPRLGPHRSSGLDDTMALGGSTGYSV